MLRICKNPKMGDHLDGIETGEVIVASKMTLAIVQNAISQGELFLYIDEVAAPK